MIPVHNILRLASDGYDARDIAMITRTQMLVVRQVCKENGVRLNPVTERPKPVMVVKNSKPAPRRQTPAEVEVRQPKTKQNPLALARNWLGKRLVEKPAGPEQRLCYWLDGLPVNLEVIMRETYGRMIAAGVEPEIPNPRWKP